MDLFRNRRSVRKFTEQQVSDEFVAQAKQVLLLAPTARNAQTTKFRFVSDKRLIAELGNARASQPYIGQCQLIVVMCKDASCDSGAQVEDAAIAAAHLQLFCTSYGLGSCWIHLNERQSADGSSSVDLVKKVCALPEHLQPHCMIIIGYPAAPAELKHVSVEASERFV